MTEFDEGIMEVKEEKRYGKAKIGFVTKAFKMLFPDEEASGEFFQKFEKFASLRHSKNGVAVIYTVNADFRKICDESHLEKMARQEVVITPYNLLYSKDFRVKPESVFH